MTTFADAVDNQRTTTTNGMASLCTSANSLTNLFFNIGSSRGKDIIPAFEAAFQCDPIIATKIALWARDAREGAGERQVFKDILSFMERNHPEMLERIIPYIPTFGRWDDGFVFITPKFKHMYFGMVKTALANGDKLCAKFCPREKSSKTHIAAELRQFLKLTPQQYRKLLVNNTDVVETKMCAKQWNDIEFGKLPSVASARYQRAFLHNAPEKYAEYKLALKSGDATVNAKTLYPYDVIKSIKHGGDHTVSIAQWEALPNYIGDAKILPLVDVSGSMCCKVGGNNNLECLDVAVSLGLYCSDKNKGVFKDLFLTFSEYPEFVKLKGDIVSKMEQMSHSDWGMNTNLERAFDLILNLAIDNKLPQDEMPEILLILSDMDFDCASTASDTVLEMISRQYQDAGYSRPKIVFWNLNAHDHYPVRFDEDGTAMVSGFSPAIMKSVLSGDEFTPESIMMETVNNPRYDF